MDRSNRFTAIWRKSAAHSLSTDLQTHSGRTDRCEAGISRETGLPDENLCSNYGAVGAIIGHELSHFFDDQGRKYDASGKVTRWWSSEEIDTYEARTKKLELQYDSYEPLPDLHINGSATLGENVADLLGLQVALDAYHLSLRGVAPESLSGWSGDQRFFLGFAQLQRSKRKAKPPCADRLWVVSIRQPSNAWTKFGIWMPGTRLSAFDLASIFTCR